MHATFDLTCDPPTARVRVSGTLDLDTGDEFENLLESLEATGCTHVELDLGALTFIDRPVLDLLRHEQRRLRVSGGDLRVVAASLRFGQACEQAEVHTLLPGPRIPR